jgi:PAS domain S-box-containing protein
MHILVVDDYQENRYLLEVLLKGHGHRVSSANNGAQALEQLTTGEFDLIISDILMPVMDGYQLCLKCKTDERLKHIPFIFYTATYIEKQDEDLALKLGADRFIRKPADPDEFMNIINGVIDEATSPKDKGKSLSLDGGILQTYIDRVVKKLDKKIMQLEDEIVRRRAAEQAMSESEEKYRSLVETGGAGIATIDLDSKFTFVNNKMCLMLGYSREELLDKPFVRLVKPEDLPVLETFLNITGTGSTKTAIEFRVIHKSGLIIWLYTNPTPMIINKNVVGFNAVVHDITALKQTEAELQKSLISLKKTLNDTVSAMAKILELKDPYTSGHQVRTAKLATAIAKKMHLPDEQVNTIETSTSIHDVGKLYVPSDILSKPGKLSDIEFKLIQAHPQGGYEILKGIEFNAPIAQIVLQHHERADGSGYPQGLKGGEILLEAKILAVADVVEAMSSYRPYRPSMGVDKALEEIKSNRGIKYDETAVDVCIELFTKDGFTFPPVS